MVDRLNLVRFSNWRSQLEERMPPERIIFLQRLLEPSFCILAPYLHTFLDRAVWQHQLLLCQNLCKSIEKKARADLAPPQICHFSATKLSLQILHFFQIGFLTILVSVFARHISGNVMGCCASLQNILYQFWCLRCDISKIIQLHDTKILHRWRINSALGQWRSRKLWKTTEKNLWS